MRVNEIFYSVQGEGRFTGTPAIFIRLSGCNLTCDFCDTEHLSHEILTEEEILIRIADYPASHVVITGGEPLLQLTSSLVEKLHQAGKYVQIETNGTYPIASDMQIDWITCSPKMEFCTNAELKLDPINELKVVYMGQNMTRYDAITASEYYIQPCDTKNETKNAEIMALSIEFVKKNPKWKLSLQTQKILNVR